MRRVLRVNSALQMGLVLAIVVFANVLGSRYFARLDLTTDRIHSLSHASRVLAERLDKPLIVKVYFTKGLEAPYNNHEQTLVDKLEEFRAWSGGKMELTVVDPSASEELQDEAKRLGITPIPYSFRSQSRSELRQVYMGASLVYGDRQKTLPAITQVATIEYDLARTIKTLIDADDVKTIGVLTGHGEPDVLGGKGPLKQLRDNLAQSYRLQVVQLGGETGVPDEVDALWIIGPQTTVPLRDQYHIDQFLMTGKPVAFFLSNFKPDMRTMRALKVPHGLDALVGHFGVEVNQDVVVDRVNNGKMNFPVQQGNYIRRLPINYPLIPMVTDLAEDSVVVKDLDAMTFPFVSSIDLPDDALGVDVLATSDKNAGRIKAPRVIQPQAYVQKDPSEETGAWPVLVTASGTYTSFFKGREIPDSPETGELVPFIDESAPTRLVVAGSADFIANNLAFMSNLADWMVQDEDLISIRSKTIQVPTLDPVEPGRLLAIKLGLLLGPILLLLAFGGLRAFVRGRSA